MSTSKDYLEYILDQLSEVEGISHRQMMGEYMIYYRGKLAVYLCDNRFLVKPVKSALALLSDAPQEPPYDGANPMILVEDTDNRELLKTLFENIYDELPAPKQKKKK